MNPYISRLEIRRKKRQLRNYFIVFFLFTSLCVLGVTFFFRYKQPGEILNPLGSSNFSLSPTIMPIIQNSAGLTKIIDTLLKNEDGTYGMYIKNVATGEMYTKNATKNFHAASLYKLWVMAVVYQQLEKGNLQKETVLSQDIPVLNSEFNIDPDVAEQTEGTITLSVVDALTSMIDISDNYSGLLLAEKVKLSSVVLFLKQNNLLSSSVGTSKTDNLPTTTPQDTALFFEKLYNGDFADMGNTEAMITLLKNQRLNEKLPKYLPDSVTIAHKTGELDSLSHDAGIVYTPKGNYIIVVMTDTTDTDHANEIIAQISKQVYAYFAE